MKKILILLLFVPLAFGQSVELKPNFDYSGSPIKITNSLNQPGLVHSSSLINGPIMGTVIKSDGVYFQTFTNHPLKFAVNNASESYKVTTASNVIVQDALVFYSLGIKQLKLTGLTDGFIAGNLATSDGLPYETRIAHGLDASKILAIKLIINADVGFSIGEEYTYSPGNRAAISHDPTYVHVWNYQTNSFNIRNKPFKILITYTN
jgi:hypothetical protein